MTGNVEVGHLVYVKQETVTNLLLAGKKSQDETELLIEREFLQINRSSRKSSEVILKQSDSKRAIKNYSGILNK